MNILFVAKQKPFAKDAADLLRMHSINTEIIFGDINEPFPNHLKEKKYDYVISYISPWIIPEKVLVNTKKAAINFHPGPPEYPGIGCTNFAIYNEEKDFGITVHHMVQKVDSGNIIFVERFPILENDSVYSLTQRCYAHIYVSFIKLLPAILSHEQLPISNDKWKRDPYTRKQLNELCKLTPDMINHEIEKRVKATTYPGMPGAYIEVNGMKFYYKSEKVI